VPRRGERNPPKVIAGDPEDTQGFPLLVAEYCEWLAVRGYAPGTIHGHRGSLAWLAGWLSERGVSRPSEVTKPMIDAYQRALYYRRKADGQPLSFRAQHGRLVPVRIFFRWLMRSNRILYNPASEIELPKTEQRLPRAVMSAEEAEQVLACPDLSRPIGVRDRTMLEVLYATGIRRAELVNLTVFGLDIERGTLMVRQGKGKKDRMIPLGQRAGAWCQRYLADVRPKFAVEPDDGTLFLTWDGARFSVQTMTDHVRGYVKRSGVGKPGSCHLFRHTMATLMLEGGADIRFIQQMLGHTDISSTQVYTQVSLKALQAVHAATHPGASNQPHSTRHGARLRPASDLAPGAAAGGEDTAEALQNALDAEAQDEQQDLHGQDGKSAA
jgi:integrase/recombinase XerD